MKKLLLISTSILLISGSAMAAGVTKGDVQRLDLDQITLDGTDVTATGAELNYNDITTLGTLAASKTWTSNASLDTIMPTGGLLTVQSGGAVTVASGATLTVAGSFTPPYEVVAEANTLSVAECGKTLYFASTVGFAQTLPAPTAGCEFVFVLATDSTASPHTIVTTGADIIFGTAVASDTGVIGDAEDTITFVSASAIPGDRVELDSDGTNWYVKAITSLAAGITFTSAI